MRQLHARQQAQKLLADLEVAHAQIAAYALRVEDLTRASERQRMARELHDTLAQGLVGLTMQLETVNLHLIYQRSERAQEVVRHAMAGTRAMMAEARCAIDDLRATRGDAAISSKTRVARRCFMPSARQREGRY